MGKEHYSLARIDGKAAAPLLRAHHYLSGISKGFRSGFNYGLFFMGELVGVCIFTNFPVAELAQGMLGLPRTEQRGLFELSRLCLWPEVQHAEHNLASWFVSRALKALRRDTHVRVVLSYADAGYHQGTVYRACNFEYYGLTAAKNDFWKKTDGGAYVKMSRGRATEGEWRPRTQKHRFAIVYDKTITVRWPKVGARNTAEYDGSDLA